MKTQGRGDYGGGLWGLLFAVACLLFSWPLVTVAGDGLGLLAYLFLSAGAVVAALLLASLRREGGDRED